MSEEMNEKQENTEGGFFATVGERGMENHGNAGVLFGSGGLGSLTANYARDG